MIQEIQELDCHCRGYRGEMISITYIIFYHKYINICKKKYMYKRSIILIIEYMIIG